MYQIIKKCNEIFDRIISLELVRPNVKVKILVLFQIWKFNDNHDNDYNQYERRVQIVNEYKIIFQLNNWKVLLKMIITVIIWNWFLKSKI